MATLVHTCYPLKDSAFHNPLCVTLSFIFVRPLANTPPLSLLPVRSATMRSAQSAAAGGALGGAGGAARASAAVGPVGRSASASAAGARRPLAATAATSQPSARSAAKGTRGALRRSSSTPAADKATPSSSSFKNVDPKLASAILNDILDRYASRTVLEV